MSAELDKQLTEVVEVSKELQDSLNNFMELLQNDIYDHLGDGIPFIAKVDIKLGVQKENESKLQSYQHRILSLVNNVPREFTPRGKK